MPFFFFDQNKQKLGNKKWFFGQLKNQIEPAFFNAFIMK